MGRPIKCIAPARRVSRPLEAFMLDRITPVILTFNEAPNIGRVLERLTSLLT